MDLHRTALVKSVFCDHLEGDVKIRMVGDFGGSRLLWTLDQVALKEQGGEMIQFHQMDLCYRGRRAYVNHCCIRIWIVGGARTAGCVFHLMTGGRGRGALSNEVHPCCRTKFIELQVPS